MLIFSSDDKLKLVIFEENKLKIITFHSYTLYVSIRKL